MIQRAIDTTATPEAVFSQTGVGVTEIRVARPRSVHRVLLMDPSWSSGLELEVEQTDNGLVVSNMALALYGVGESLDEAVDDFREAAALMHEDLSEEGVELSRALGRRLRRLRLYLGWLFD